MKIKDLSIGKKLILGFGMVLVLTLVLLIVGWNGFDQVKERYWQTSKYYTIELNLLNARMHSRVYIQYEQTTQAEALMNRLNLMLVDIDALAPTLTKKEHQDQLNRMREETTNYRNAANNYIAVTKVKQDELSRFDEYAVRIMNEVVTSNASQASIIGFMNARVYGQKYLRLNTMEDYRSWERTVDQIRPDFSTNIQALLGDYKSTFAKVHQYQKEQKDGEEAFRVAGENLTKVIDDAVKLMNQQMIDEIASALTLMISMGVIAIIIGIFFSMIINNSIRTGINNGVSIAAKIADGDISVTIEKEYIDRKDEIGELLRSLQRMSDKLKEIISSIITGTGNIASASEQMSSTSQELSQGASEQASSVEEVSSSMEEMASNIQQNNDNAQQTEKISLNVSQGVQKVGVASKESLDSIKNIADKIGIINDIAFQTNILALNAAVEAARAGEHGKGFAVVAAEVRKLAERSKVAADEIVSLASKSVLATEEASKLLGNLIPEIDKTSKLVQEISAASIEQSSGANQINNAIQQLNQITQQNAAASEEMATSAEELSSQAEQLNEVVAYFKIDGLSRDLSIKQNAKLKKVVPPKKVDHPLKQKGIHLNMASPKVDDSNFQNY